MTALDKPHSLCGFSPPPARNTRDLTRLESAVSRIYNSPTTLQTGEVPMPHYEFFCHECKKLFAKILSLVDYEEDEVLCPHCGSKEVEQRWSAFSVLTTKKSA
jgi:putative FmdB family regulatory protein